MALGKLEGYVPTLGDAVMAARNARSWSQGVLAKAAGLSEKTVRRVEAGDSPSGETVLSLCAALGLDAASFVVVRPVSRTALPDEDSVTDEIRAGLARTTGTGATVIAVDTAAYLREQAGLTPEQADRQLREVREGQVFGRRGRRALAAAAAVAPLTVCVLAAFGIRLDLALLVGMHLFVSVAWFARRSCPIKGFDPRRSEMDEAVSFCDRMRRSVYAVHTDKLVAYGLDDTGTVQARCYPLASQGHRVREAGDSHWTFVFSLLDGRIEIPFVPRLPASVSLAERLSDEGHLPVTA